MRKKIIIALSGGVDSAVSALLLKKQGFAPVGIFMRFWEENKNKGFSRFFEAEKRAEKVAQTLKIPFYVLDLHKEFKKRVINYFLKEQKKGRTPNPCVVCNKRIKFGLVFEKALEMGISFIATGHYARIKKDNNRYLLLRARDKKKDQSYFLWMLDQKQLSHIIFPLGNHSKEKVKLIAKKNKLFLKPPPESHEICFVPKDINDFLKRHLKEKRGKIVDLKGNVLGFHSGLWFYTLGQRKGIGLSGGPFYVVRKDYKKNLLIVSKNQKDLFKKEIVVEETNWIVDLPQVCLGIKAKIRYRQELTPVEMIKALPSKRYLIRFKNRQRVPTPGQSIVFYQKEMVLGGGIIRNND